MLVAGSLGSAGGVLGGEVVYLLQDSREELGLYSESLVYHGCHGLFRLVFVQYFLFEGSEDHVDRAPGSQAPCLGEGSSAGFVHQEQCVGFSGQQYCVGFSRVDLGGVACDPLAEFEVFLVEL